MYRFNKTVFYKILRNIKLDFYWLSIFSLATVKSLYLSSFGLVMFDYGESLHNGLRILQGFTLYKDIWSFFPPADVYFPALILKVFPSFLSIRYVESIIFGLFVVVIGKIAKRILNKKYLLLFCLLIIFANAQTYTWYVLLFFYTPVLFIINFFEKRQLSKLFLAGVTIGFGSLFRHDKYLTFTIALCSVLFFSWYTNREKFRELIKNIFIFILGSACVVGLEILWFIKRNILFEFIELAFIKGPKISSMFSKGFWGLEIFSNPFSLRGGYDSFALFVYVFYLTILILTGIYIFKTVKKRLRIKTIDISIVSLFAVALAELPYAFSVVDLGHLLTASMGVWAIGLYFTSSIKFTKQKILKAISLMSFTLLFLGNIVIVFWTASFYQEDIYLKGSKLKINTNYITGTTNPSKKTIVDTLSFIERNSKTDDYIFAIPYHSMIYYLSDRKDPSKYNNFLPGYMNSTEEQELVTTLRALNIKVVVYDSRNAPLGRVFKNYYPLVHQYIIENYETIEETQEGWLLMLKR